MKLTVRLLLLGVSATMGMLSARAEPAPPKVPALAGARIRLRVEYRHLKLTPLPDAASLVAESAMASGAAVEALPQAQRDLFARVTAAIWAGKSADLAAAKESWRELIESTRDAAGPVDVDALIRVVVHGVGLSGNPELRLAALQAHLLGQQRALVQEHLDALRAESPNKLSAAQRAKNNAQASAWEELVKALGADHARALLALQDAMDVLQERMQLMTSISKMMHDMTKSIIQNMR